MKIQRTFATLLSLAMCPTSAQSLNDFKIILESTWKNLETEATNAHDFGGKWVLIGSITFYKKAKEAINLQKLHLHWQGKPIDTLLGSLYKKNPRHEFLPIDDYLVCDGTWNSTQQTLMLNFEKHETLGLSNTFYLVLTIPNHLEDTVKQGEFELVDECLPEPFQDCLAQEKISLAFNLPAQHKTVH